MREIWKLIPSMPNYAVSSLGRVKALERQVRFVSKRGKECWRLKKENLISLQQQNG